MTRMHYREQDLQIRFVKWFRVTYPAFAHLMFHPKNEEAGGRVRGAIAKAEGVTAGVADLMFLIPTQNYIGMAIELKSKNGCMRQQQKLFKRYFEAVGGKYVTARTFEGCCDIVTQYMDDVTPVIWGDVNAVHDAIEAEAKEEARLEMQRILKEK